MAPVADSAISLGPDSAGTEEDRQVNSAQGRGFAVPTYWDHHEAKNTIP